MTQDTVQQLLHQYGTGFVFALIALESMGLPLPGETVMIAAALYAAATHHLSLGGLLAAAAAGAILGGATGFAIGRIAGTRLLVRYGPRIGLTADRRLLGRYLMYRNGAALVFFGRFIALLRALASLLAGASGMGWRRFMVFNVLGGLAWPAIYCGGAYALGHAATHVAGAAGIAIGAAAAVVLAIGFVFVRRHEHRLTQLAIRAEAAGELGQPIGQPAGT